MPGLVFWDTHKISYICYVKDESLVLSRLSRIVGMFSISPRFCPKVAFSSIFHLKFYCNILDSPCPLGSSVCWLKGQSCRASVYSTFSHTAGSFCFFLLSHVWCDPDTFCHTNPWFLRTSPNRLIPKFERITHPFSCNVGRVPKK